MAMRPDREPLCGFDNLWSRLAEAVRDKLISGEWEAEGFTPENGPYPVRIDRHMWRFLDFDGLEGDAAGGGFRFSGLVFSSRTPSIGTAANLASRRAQVARWIDEQAALGRGPTPKPVLLSDARRAFPDWVITEHLFERAWHEAERTDELRVKGCPIK